MSRKDSKGRVLRKGESERDDGRYMYRFTNSGKRITIYADSLKELREQESKIQNDLYVGVKVKQQCDIPTLNECFEIVMQTRKLADRTKANQRMLWDIHIASWLGKQKVTDVMPSAIKMFYNRLDKKGYSRSTIKILHTMLKQSFDIALDDDLIRKNPTDRCLGENGRPVEEKIALSVKQQNNLLEFAESHKVYCKHLPMIQILLMTACRCGEMLGLTWSDIDYKNDVIKIDHQLIYTKLGKTYEFHITQPKTSAGIRDLPLTPELKEAFNRQKLLNFMNHIPRTYRLGKYRDFIFLSKNGTPLLPSAVNSILYNLVKAYNKQEKMLAEKEEREPEYMPKISAHSLRHTACTRFAESGVDIKVLQYIMGHTKADITMNVYAHLTERSRIEQAFANMTLKAN